MAVITLSLPQPKALNTQADYDTAMARLEDLYCKQSPSREEQFELIALARLCEDWEEAQDPTPVPNLRSWLSYALERGAFTREQLDDVVGDRTVTANILAGRRKASLPVRQKLYKQLAVPIEVLLSDERTEILEA